ncbi:AzlD domain-containing protein [Pseudogemmobacter bohemicus]|uniref:AzlD domain-containing protein n=1 Tax=Pseudogemmobacter bohemicus TaxID=2250708 RepID=UPI000DD38B0B|nr:AzlD domain-containing protein [Pseudogemmobacter bohemicus]
MNPDLILMAVLAGLANWGFRALPILLMRGEARPGGLMAGFLASTGPAAIATLFVASALPRLWPEQTDLVPLAMGVLITVLAFLPRRSVVVATLAGSLAYGIAFALMHPALAT